MHAVVDNYRQWRDLGAGGLPHNPAGWAAASALKVLARDPLQVRRVPRDLTSGAVFDLPARRGPRPAVAPFPIPHRQLDPDASPARIEAVADYVARCATDDPRHFHIARSLFERHGDALFVSDTDGATPWIAHAKGEVAHVHRSDGTLHVVAHPVDAQQIIDAGWGELHPLAGRRMIGLPESYLFLYAPRDGVDQRHVQRILDRVVGAALLD